MVRMKWVRNIFVKRSSKTGEFRTVVDEKVKEGIDFTLKNYAETLKDLARYDRGESFSR